MAANKSKPEGRKSDKVMQSALRIALKRKDAKGTRYDAVIARKLVEAAAEGNIRAIALVCDRVDGKARQEVNASVNQEDSNLDIAVARAEEFLASVISDIESNGEAALREG